MRKILILIIFSILICALFTNCGKNPLGPEDPSEMAGTIEILYERVCPVINPYADDPSGCMLYHWKYKFKESSNFVKIEENKFKAEVYLVCDLQPYEIWTVDGKIMQEYFTIGKKFYLRVKGSSNWIELTCVVKNNHSESPKSTAAKFIFNHGRIQNPVHCDD